MEAEETDYDYYEEYGLQDCPNCNRSYDEIDYDFQICSKCGWDENKKQICVKSIIEPNDNDYLAGDADPITGRWH